MHKGLLALNIVLLVAVGILFFLFFNKKNKVSDPIIKRPAIDTAAAWEHTPVAYFEMDSVEANFSYFKQMQDEVLRKEQIKDDSINRMKASLQMRYQQFQEQQSKMTPEEIQKSRDYFVEQNENITKIEKDLNQKYQQDYVTEQQKIITLIKNYCQEFNKDGKYSYIIVYDAGLLYYTDTAYNVTSEFIKGLNKYYNKKKKD